jgi:hypothetical protein
MDPIKNPTKKPSARLWPSRDFTLGYSLGGLEDFFHAPTVVIDGDPVLLGSSNRLISHKNGEEEIQQIRKRARRGQKGLSPHGKMLVKNAASYLQKRYGKSRLSFLTLTLPGVTAEESREISQNWSEIVRKFLQTLRRQLIAAGLPPQVISVTEVQEKRFQRDGVLGLHLHLVFVGRHRAGGWVLTPHAVRSYWCRAFPKTIQSYEFSSTENLQRVKGDAARYLSKYLSKGVNVLGNSPQIEKYREVLPTSWYNCTDELRSQVKRLVMSGKGISEMIALIVEHAVPDALEFLMPIYVEIDGYEFIAGWRGKLKKDAYKYLYNAGHPSLDFLGETFPPGFEPGKFDGF